MFASQFLAVGTLVQPHDEARNRENGRKDSRQGHDNSPYRSAVAAFVDPPDPCGGAVARESKRSLLFDMDMAIIKLSRDQLEHTSVVELTSVFAPPVGRTVAPGKAQKENSPERSGAVLVLRECLFQALGSFLRQAKIDVVLDVDLLLHKSKVMRHVDVAL